MRPFVHHAQSRRLAVLSLAVATLFAPVIARSAATPVYLWGQHAGAANSDDFGYAVATDPQGNIYCCGSFGSTVNFGGTNLVSAGSHDIFLVKYNANGVQQWVHRFGDIAQDEAYGICADAAGNVTIAGYFSGVVNFGGFDRHSAGGQDMYLASYDTNGNHRWSRSFGSYYGDQAWSVAADPQGNVLLTGSFAGTVNFGGTPLTSPGTFETDIVLAKYDSGGTHQWSLDLGGPAADSPFDVTCDDAGNVCLFAQVGSSANLGGATLSAGMAAAKYTSSGGHIWSRTLASAASPRGIACDHNGNIVLTGIFQGTVNLGNGPLVGAGGYDMFLAKLDPNGTSLWSERFGGSGQDMGMGVGVDAHNDILLAGHYTSAGLNLGGSPLTPAGSYDNFIAKYTADGTHLWSKSYGGTQVEQGWDVAVDNSGNPVATGGFNGSSNLGGGTINNAGGGYDFLVVKYSGMSAEPIIQSITDVPNDQGHHVTITFSRSGYDVSSSPKPTTQYEIYRHDGPNWIQVAIVPAGQQLEYAADAPTLTDSTIVAGQFLSEFLVQAFSLSPLATYPSTSATGYSVDNLAPDVPASVAFASGTLSWDTSPAADFDHFSVYGANSNSFAAGSLVNHTNTPQLDVSALSYAFYFVTASDVSGNESAPGSASVATTIPETPRAQVLSISNYPNPFNPQTTVKYTVPSRGMVDINVYDASGVHVVTLFHGERSAGAYSVAWDGRGAGGASVGSGIYFARISHHGVNQTKKMTLLK